MSTTTVTASKMTATQQQSQSQTQSQAPQKKSWAVMAYEADEEERLEREEENREKYRKIIKQRQYLHSIGKYELEEGEILE